MDKGTIIFVSDMDLKGSGYSTISIPLCQGLQENGYKVIALGAGYARQPHAFDFTLVPVNHLGMVQQIIGMVKNLRMMGENIVALVVALDMPLQIEFIESIIRDHIPYIAIYPVESGPVANKWASKLSSADGTLVISGFGRDQARDAGIDAEFIPIGIDADSWKVPSKEERAAIRSSMGISPEEKFILTVADNHERKNLWAAMDIISYVSAGIPIKWGLVSRFDFKAGYLLGDLARYCKIDQIWMPFERGLPFEKLWALHAAADLHLITSKAEGLGLPILESLSTGTPVAATDNTAVTELIPYGGVLGLPSEYNFIDPWSNSWRDFVDREKSGKLIIELLKDEKRLSKMGVKGRKYIEEHRQQKVGLDILVNIIEKSIEERKQYVSKTKAADNVAIL